MKFKRPETIEEKVKFYDDIMCSERCHYIGTYDNELDREFSALLFIDFDYPVDELCCMLLHVIEHEIGKENFQQFVWDNV